MSTRHEMSTIHSDYTSKALINQYKTVISLFPIITPNLEGKDPPNIINTKNSSNSWMQNHAKFRAPHS